MYPLVYVAVFCVGSFLLGFVAGVIVMVRSEPTPPPAGPRYTFENFQPAPKEERELVTK
jgi:hypothetical protein